MFVNNSNKMEALKKAPWLCEALADSLTQTFWGILTCIFLPDEGRSSEH